MEYRATAHTYTKNAFDINSIVDGVCMYLFMLSIGMEHKLHKNAILSTLISNGHKAMRRRRKKKLCKHEKRIKTSLISENDCKGTRTTKSKDEESFGNVMQCTLHRDCCRQQSNAVCRSSILCIHFWLVFERYEHAFTVNNNGNEYTQHTFNTVHLFGRCCLCFIQMADNVTRAQLNNALQTTAQWPLVLPNAYFIYVFALCCFTLFEIICERAKLIFCLLQHAVNHRCLGRHSGVKLIFDFCNSFGIKILSSLKCIQNKMTDVFSAPSSAHCRRASSVRPACENGAIVSFPVVIHVEVHVHVCAPIQNSCGNKMHYPI